MDIKTNQTARQRGAAMVLVIIAIAMAVIIALSFLHSQKPTAAVAANIDRHAEARAIAESGLEMAIEYVRNDADWRSANADGVWITDVTLNGGTFTVYGTDEDGDLNDDSSDTLVLAVVGTFKGVTHRVSARVTPDIFSPVQLNVAFVVRNDSNLTFEETAKQSLFEDWGYTVMLLDDGATQSEFDAAIIVSEVAFISSEASYGSVGKKLRTHAIGVVYELSMMSYYFDIAYNGAIESGTTIRVIDADHYITSPFGLGEIQVAQKKIWLHENKSRVADGAQRLGEPLNNHNYSIIAVEVGADLLDGSTATARRVKLPWSDDTSNLNGNGRLLTRRALEWAANNEAGSAAQLIVLYEFEEPPAITPTLLGHWKLDDDSSGSGGMVLIRDELEMGEGAIIDAYDSTDGVYGGTNSQLDTRFITNAIANDDVTLNDSTIYGDVIIGAGGNPSSVIQLDNESQITGTTQAAGSNAIIPDPNVPKGFGSPTGIKTYRGKKRTWTWSEDKYFSGLIIERGAEVYVSGNVSVRVKRRLTMDNGHIILNPGASLTLWVGQNVYLSNGSTINNDTSRPKSLTLIQYADAWNMGLNDSIVCGVVHCSDDLNINHNSAIYGSVSAEGGLALESGGALHMDLSIEPMGGSGSAVASDESTAGNDGSVNDATPGVAGQHGTAFAFDGDDDYVQIAHSNAYLLDEGSVSFWFYPQSLSGHQGLFSKDADDYGTGGHLHVYAEGSSLKCRVQNNASGLYGALFSGTLTSASGLSSNTWHHAAVTWGDGQIRMYLDGAVVDVINYEGGIATTSGGIGNYEPIVLGANTWSSGDLSATPLQNYFEGRIDDVRIYDLPLDTSQIGDAAAGSTPGGRADPDYRVLDTSGFGDPLDLVVNDTSLVTWETGGGLTLNGDAQAVSIGPAAKLYDEISGTGEFSVEVRFNRASPGSTSSPSRIASFGQSTSSRNFLIGQDGSAYEARVRTTTVGSNGQASPDFSSGSVLTTGDEVHLVLSFKDGQVTSYLNGQLDKTQDFGGDLSTWSDNMPLVLGNEYGGGYEWQGTLLYFAIFDRALNTSQADNLYQGMSPGEATAGGDFTATWIETD